MHEPKLVELKLGSGSGASKAPSTVLANFNSSDKSLGVKIEQVKYNSSSISLVFTEFTQVPN